MLSRHKKEFKDLARKQKNESNDLIYIRKLRKADIAHMKEALRLLKKEMSATYLDLKFSRRL